MKLDTATDSSNLLISKPSKVLFEKLRPYLIFALLFLVGLYRFSLIDRGALSQPDEVRYWDAADAWEKLVAERDVRGFFIAIASATNGRTIGTNKPGDTMLRLIPSFFQGVLWKLSGGFHARDAQSNLITSGIHFRNPESLKIPTFFNVVLSLYLLWVFYKISLLVFKGEESLALIGTLVYALLANSNIYIRHILPYDAALLFFLFSLYYILKETTAPDGKLSLKTCAIGGMLAGFGFTIYPGYYFLPVLPFCAIFFISNHSLFSKFKLLRCLAFGAGFISALLFFEGIARLGKTHYLLHLSWYFGKQDQGSFEEGFTFLPKYMFEVEKSIGVVMLFFAGYFILQLFFEFFRSKNKTFRAVYLPDLKWMILVMFAGYLFHANASVNRSMVFYGRLLHMYFPFLVWAAIAALSKIQPVRIKKLLLYFVIPLLSLVSFVQFAAAYSQIAYPLDVLYKLGIDTGGIPSENQIFESEPNPDLFFVSPPPFNFKTNQPYQEKGNYILVNFCSFFSLAENKFKPFTPTQEARLIYQRPHFNTFPAYTFEAYTIEKRRHLREKKYQVSVYELIS